MSAIGWLAWLWRTRNCGHLRRRRIAAEVLADAARHPANYCEWTTGEIVATIREQWEHPDAHRPYWNPDDSLTHEPRRGPVDLDAFGSPVVIAPPPEGQERSEGEVHA